MHPTLLQLQPLLARGDHYVPVDPRDAAVASILADLPGGIFSAHGREFAELCFIRWDAAATGRRWARAMGAKVTTTALQRAQAEAYKAGNRLLAGEAFVGLYLSARGFAELEHPALQPAAAPIDAGPDDAFRIGLTDTNRKGVLSARAVSLGDDPADWEAGYFEVFHAVLLVAYDGPAEPAILRDPTGGIDGVEVVLRESGFRLTNQAGQEIEHFGHRDGLARMRFLDTVPTPGPDVHPLWQVLRETAPAPDGSRRYGSFLVLRKMEQDVAGYHAQLGRIAALHFGGDNPAGRDQASAWLVGRFPDGSPRETHDHPPEPPDPTDDFTFAGNPSACPYHAHIRKMNPRGLVNPFREKGVESRLRLPVRRSTAYDDFSLPATRRRGLLFMAFVADIPNQFEHLVREWANQDGFPVESATADPLIGRPADRQPVETLMPSHPAHPSQVRSFRVSGQVKTVGGAYLWAPPRSFLTTLPL